MELSLDEIIQKNKSEHSNGRKKFTKTPLRKTLNKPAFKETRPIGDARMKIIQKNRAKIIDARDKLLEVTKITGDARQLIENRRSTNDSSHKRNGVQNNYNNGRQRERLYLPKAAGPAGPIYRNNIRRPRLPVPRGYVDYDNMEQFEEQEYIAAQGLVRTVRNDARNIITRMDYSPTRTETIPPPPTASSSHRLNSWNSQASDHFDPFDIYERHERRMSPPPTQLPPPPPKGILRPSRASPELYKRRYIPEVSSHLSYEMRSRLENAPDPHLSAGIFSSNARASSSSGGYRIVVSNLHPSVTQSDIQELFEDIGELYDSRIVRPGIAEVIYKSLADAEKAVDIYHNRQLDHQPMKCLLVNPRASDKPTAPAIHATSSKTRQAAGKTPLEIDIDALHKVLFRRN